MNALAEQTLANIVNDNFRAAEVLEKYNLDFCCKGKKITLGQACETNKLDLNSILKELDIIQTSNGNSSAQHRFQDWGMSFLADYIVNEHHTYVRDSLPRLLAYTEKIAYVHGNKHPELLQIADLFDGVAQELRAHMQKEEVILFPFIKKLEQAQQNKQPMPEPPFGTVVTPISMMEAEHEDAGNALYKIRKLSNAYTPPEDACNTYRVTFAELDRFERDLHQHVHLENNILFPKALAAERKLNELQSR